jgi:hypothetical protein
VLVACPDGGLSAGTQKRRDAFFTKIAPSKEWPVRLRCSIFFPPACPFGSAGAKVEALSDLNGAQRLNGLNNFNESVEGGVTPGYLWAQAGGNT